jgi:hypothetical protein
MVSARNKREIEVELESHELVAIRHLHYLDDIMTDVLDCARPSDVDGFVVLTARRFALEHFVGEIAHEVNHSRRWTAQIDALSNAADAIEWLAADAYELYVSRIPPGASDREEVERALRAALAQVATLSIELDVHPTEAQRVDRPPVDRDGSRSAAQREQRPCREPSTSRRAVRCRSFSTWSRSRRAEFP